MQSWLACTLFHLGLRFDSFFPTRDLSELCFPALPVIGFFDPFLFDPFLRENSVRVVAEV